MSRSNYKRLGDYIREVNVRNRDLAVTRLVGININKYFMPSVANVIGTDMSNYKVVSQNQFACNLMHVGRDERIPMAMQSDGELIIVSPAYFVFEIIDKSILLPEYLMMWFSRAEFDRNAWFYTDADVRGGMNKGDLFEMTLPIPAIEVQREIVSEYASLSRRVALNESLCDKLEQAAAALYRKTFIENIDPQNLPHGWRMGTLGEFAEFKNGKAIQVTNGIYSVYGGNGIVGNTNEYNANNIIVIGRVGANCGNIVLEPNNCWVNDNAIMAIPKSCGIDFLFWLMKGYDFNSQSEGSGQPLLTQTILNGQQCIIPTQSHITEFCARVNPIMELNRIQWKEIDYMQKLQSLLLSKLATN